MAITVTAAQVLSLISTSLAETAVDVFVTDAAEFVEERLGSTSLSEARLNVITKYLAAHLIAMTIEPEHRVSKEAKGQVYRQERGDKLDLALNNTTWGQMVLFFDSTGTLADDNLQEKFGKLFEVYGITQ